MKKASVRLIRTILCMAGAMMIFSMTACTPTDKGKDVSETETVAPTAPPKNPDPTAPVLDVVSVYCVSEDGSKLEGTMDAVDELNEESLVALLVQYGVLEEGTEALDFKAEGAPSSEEVGPGVVKIPGVESEAKEYGTLNLNKFPDTENELLLQAVANTFIENMNIVYLTIQVNGEAVAENLSMADAVKQ